MICAALFIVIGCDNRNHELYLEGKGEAERDLKKGLFTISIPDNTNMPAFYEYVDLLRKRYHVGSVVVSENWSHGYNDVALARVEREIGEEALKQAMRDAQGLHDSNQTATNNKTHASYR